MLYKKIVQIAVKIKQLKMEKEEMFKDKMKYFDNLYHRDIMI